jgi:hypothetical protein
LNEFFIPGILTIVLTTACDRRNETPPAVQPQPTQAVTQPATIPALPVSMEIDQQPYDFPPAVLIFENRDDQVVAEISSDDPPRAAQEGYEGNSFDLDMPVTIVGDSLDGAQWRYKAANSDREDEIEGIFLKGRRKLLQPFDVRADFVEAKPLLKIEISGTFLMFDSDDDKQAGKPVMVKAEISAVPRLKSSRPATAPWPPRQ